ncbi:hypothetical protein ACLSU7_08720 [Bdellovibrio sp. HCB185ZH]|uniref:hypothetical protein n=1 Tax=Bdellovibrio sp. HCB185ZH TaxID=3394235 RepID=UPI0039A4CD1F
MKALPCFIIILIFASLSFAREPQDWWSVSPEQVADAPCKNHRAPSDAEMLQALQPSSLTKKSETIYGVSFKDEDPELLQLFRDLHFYDISMLGAKPLVLKSPCNKVLCSVQAIYGTRVGIQILYMLKRFGFNGSHLRTANASLWRADELEDILTALSDYPNELYPLDYNRKLVHVKRGNRMKLPVGESVANSTMEIYDMWNDLTQAERQQSLLHELGHVVARKDDVDDSPEWFKTAGWQVSGRTARLVDPSKAVSLYGKTNPHEDFAESVVAYRFGGAKLKSEQSGKYEFLKARVFDGKEYLSAQACMTSKSQTEVKKEANNKAFAAAVEKAKRNADNLDSAFIGKAQAICQSALVKVMVDELGSAQNCTSRALQRLQLEKYGKGKKLVGALLSEAQLNAIAFKGDTEADFSRRVRAKFATDVSKSFSSDFREAVNRGTCSAWGNAAQMFFTSGPMVAEVLSKDRQYFYKNRRYEQVTEFFTHVCQTVRQNAGRLDSGILQNLP